MATIDATTPQLKLVKQLFDALPFLDLNKTESLLSDNFKMRSFPEDVEHPDEAKEEFLKKRGGVLALVSKVELIIHEVIEAPGKVVTHTTFVLTIDGTPFEYESVLIFTFVEKDGELKFLELKDFCDPQQRGAVFATRFWPRGRPRKLNLQA